MRYTLPIHLETIFDLVKYTVTAMKEVGFDSGEIEEYLTNATSGHNCNLIDVSAEQLESCNRIIKSIDDTEDEYSWRDSYYSSRWYKENDSYFDDDDDDEWNMKDDEEDLYEGFEDSGRPHKYYWEDDLEDSDEAYEGFDSCKNKVYCSDDNDESEELLEDYGYHIAGHKLNWSIFEDDEDIK